ncbi:hypothetical protein DEJ48_20310 [Streptomyces venezuelae]|uniref:Uncharacterized protein n=1 Tax=Streptomyces venezuelae TaxID=54571 RepID=A0A5P2C458_STRVZ|nr:hypothetical protein [Streptomyces venezuelae]QES35459.1 hypothetical protein DEJ48_20310 [Streptomyces venezuelae]
MPTDEAEGPSGGARRRGGTGRHDAESGTRASEELAYLVGGLLIELGSKIQEAGVDGVRILTEEEAQQSQLRWFQEGWAEHARASEHARTADDGPGAGSPAGHAGHADEEPRSMGSAPASSGRLLRFPSDAPRGTHPLPIVGTDEARGTRDLMAHRPRRRREDGPKRTGPDA